MRRIASENRTFVVLPHAFMTLRNPLKEPL